MKPLPLDDGITSMTPTSGSQRQRYSYSPAKHVNSGCGCCALEAPHKLIREILRSGGVPLLSIGTNENGKLMLRAKRYDGRINYVVIQHTQIDGIASSSDGTITHCQLLRIAIRLGELQAKEVRGELCFWLDTLCEDRARASPSSVFEEAYAALIIDPSLQSARSVTEAGDVRSHFADIVAGHPRLALNRRPLLVGAYGCFDGRGR